MANQAIRGLRQLCRGEFDDSILGSASSDPPVQVTPLGRAAAEAILEKVRARPPPRDRLSPDDALRRLQGAGAAGLPVPSAKEQSRAGVPPAKGSYHAVVVEDVALPEKGSQPIPLASLSPRAGQFLANYRTLMLAPEGCSEVELGTHRRKAPPPDRSKTICRW